MSRAKLYKNNNVPKSVVNIVAAICRDYYRRDWIIKTQSQGKNIILIQKYIELNSVIDKALSEIEPGISQNILNDIISGRGYQYSEAKCLSKDAYYRRRRKLIYDIAKALSLL